MNQKFAEPTAKALPAIGDQVRVWLRNDGSQPRPQIVEGTLRQLLITPSGDPVKIVVITSRGYETLDKHSIGSIERID